MKQIILGIGLCILLIATATTVFAAQEAIDLQTNTTLPGAERLLVNETWTKTFVVNPFGENTGNSIDTTTDGGYIIAGSITPKLAWQPNVCLIKTDAQGNMTWMKTFGGIGFDVGFCVKQTSDGGYIVAAIKNFFSILPFNPSKAWVIKTDATGNKVWEKKIFYKDLFFQLNQAFSILETSDGGYVTATVSASSVHLVKLSASGTTMFDKQFMAGSKVQSIVETPDHGFIGVGYEFNSTRHSDVWVFKANEFGDLVWEKTYGGSGDDYGKSIVRNSEGHYVIAGSTTSFGPGPSNVWILKIDGNGTVLVNTTIGSDNHQDDALSVKMTNDGGYIVAGNEQSQGHSDVGLILKFNSTLSVQWTQTVGNDSSNIYFHAVTQASDNAYVLTGASLGPLRLTGKVLLMKTFGRE